MKLLNHWFSGDATCYHDLASGVKVSFGEVERRVAGICESFVTTGIKSGAVLAVLLPNTVHVPLLVGFQSILCVHMVCNIGFM
jgi:hypothetical protein